MSDQTPTQQPEQARIQNRKASFIEFCEELFEKRMGLKLAGWQREILEKWDNAGRPKLFIQHGRWCDTRLLNALINELNRQGD
jgi:hypothetical protein